VLPSLLVFIVAAVAALVLTPRVRAWARHRGLLDKALTSRKVHTSPVPRLGGLAIGLGATLASLSALLFAPSLREAVWADSRRALSLLAGSLAIAGLGALDDLRGARIRHKLLVQLAAACLVWWGGFRLELLPVPWGEALPLGPLGLPITLLWLVGVTNAVNLLDGLDGLAAGQALIALTAYMVLALAGGQPLLALVAAAAAGASLGFLRYNRHPASIFMGDTGSLLLGFLLAACSVSLVQAAPPGAAMLAPAVAIALPVADALLAFARRLLRGFPVGRGDRGHLHHRVLERVGSHSEAVLVLWGAALVLALASLSLAFASTLSAALTLAALAAAGLVCLRVLGYLPFERRRELLLERRRNLELRADIRQSAERLRFASSPERVWEVVREAGTRVLGASTVGLVLPSGPGMVRYEVGAGRPAPFLSRFSLQGDRPGEAVLELGWDDGRTGLDRDTEVAVELLCDKILGALGRVARRVKLRAAGRPASLRVDPRLRPSGARGTQGA